MRTAKKFGLASVALISLGVSIACCVMAVAARQGQAGLPELGCLAPLAVATLTTLLLLAFWRRLRRSVGDVSQQLDAMARQKEVGLVMVESSGELSPITRPLNQFLTGLKDTLNQLRCENRELQIQSRICEAEKKHTEAIIFSISDAVVVTNRFDELILANEPAEKLLGFRLEPSLRKNIDQIIHDGTLVRLIRSTRSGGRGYMRKVVEHTIDSRGQPRVFAVTLSCVMSDQGQEVSGVVAVLHDVTREKEIAQMKTDFVSNVSHELRTPLSSIKAYVEMLQDGEADDEKTRREFYEIIAGEADRLNRLIDNILNISRIESGVVRVMREPIVLTAVARQALDVLAPQAKAKNLRLADKLVPVYRQVEADRDMIYQAIINLVSNAIKYTPEGGTVSVATSIDEKRGVALCEVSDTGVGIEPEDLPRIFEKFYRVQSSVKMAKGTGLGLTLVKHIIETVHEGKLSVTSERGKGATFSFELPLLKEALVHA